MSTQSRRVLAERFGFDSFRGVQEQVVDLAVEGKSSLVIMPTGMGKSLCYQLPGEMLEGLTLVISPLIALMKDQVDAARAKGIKCAYINSSLSGEERRLHYRQLSGGTFKLLYVTPERFRKPEFLEAVGKNKVSLLAVDEAHCISQWGHDFRPDYSRLKEIREILGRPPTMALTATATKDVQEDILRQLDLPESTNKFLFGIERENLEVSVEDLYGLEQKVQLAVALRHQYPGSGIFYFSLISTLQKVSEELSKLGVEHLVYHGQLPERFRKRNQEQFIKGKDMLILATPAFGLGVDKPDVRSVVHFEIPASIEAYYQEIGRGGRDGLPSQCVLLFDPDDIAIQMDFIKWASPGPDFIRQVYQLLADNKDQVRAEGLDYVRGQLNFYNRRDFRVETAVNLLDRWGCIAIDEKRRNFIETIEGPPEEYLDKEAHKARLLRQNEKLLQMVNLAKQDGNFKETIYEYFGV